MVVDECRLPPGIVFRRAGAAERTWAGGRAYRSPRLAGDEQWSGLWNLTDTDALWAVAATVRLSAAVWEVRAMAVRAGVHGAALWDRLLRELADAFRAHGAEWMVARADVAAANVLRDSGFAAAPDLRPELDPGVWLAREV